jgi:hypothetical protein
VHKTGKQDRHSELETGTTRVVPEVHNLTKKKKHFGKKMSLFLYIVFF